MASTPVATPDIVNVTAFIDWNSQLLLAGDPKADPEGIAESAFRQLTRRIARCLNDVDPSKRFRVLLRLYHGWHKGYEPTANRKAAQVVLGRADYAALSPRPNVIFSPDVGFGDKLTHALDKRLNRGLGIHLPNTLRRRFGDELEEKMVDTALTADVVAMAHRETSDWILVVTEDDDLVPAAYVAEAVLAAFGARVLLLRKRIQATMLALDGLLRTG